MKTYQLYINGEYVPATSNATIDVIDPSTTEVIATTPDASAADVDTAVRAARAAFDDGPWKDATAQDRGRVLFKLAQIVRDRAGELAEIETRNGGKPIVESEFDIADVATCFEYYGGLATKIQGDVLPVPDNAISLALREPIGVAGQIVPWNYPLLMAAWKMAPAICAGCTTVLKPAEQTPLSLLALASSFEDAGLPPGVVNVVTGMGETAGAAIVEHPEVDVIAFTGSAEVGKIIMRSAAGTLKKISLELGGNAPFLVFDDADLDRAVAGAILCKFRNAGQVCIAANRLLVQDGIHDAFVERYAQAITALRVGAGTEQGVTVGPLIDRQGLEKVVAHVQDARAKGAEILLGGGRHERGGLFFEPTLLTGVTDDMAMSQDETFGPVAGIRRFGDENEGIRIANDTPYGLAAYFYSRDIGRVWRVGEGLEYGIVGVNTGFVSTEVAPFGGMKESGMGREGSKYGIEDWL